MSHAPENWFLYTSFLGLGFPFPVLASAGSAALYLLCVFIIWPRTRPRTPESVRFWTIVRKFHNIALFIFSFVMCSVTGIYLFMDDQIGFGTFERLSCVRAPLWLWKMHIVFTISKLYEMCDTMFLVFLRPQTPKTFLHVFHHATTFWLFLCVSNFPNSYKTGLLLNGGVHTLMYAHYAWPFPKPFVPLITLLQLAQLNFVLYGWYITPSTCSRYANYPREHPFEFVTPIVFGCVYILFFVNFFVQRFIRRKPKRALKSA